MVLDPVEESTAYSLNKMEECFAADTPVADSCLVVKLEEQPGRPRDIYTRRR